MTMVAHRCGLLVTATPRREVNDLAAVAVLAEREPRLSAVQRLALVDAAAWWMIDPDGGEELAHALIDGACSDPVTTQQVYLALITAPQPD
jgi:hypothetical protein